ncbi:MAG TPA: DNA polymerase III subunit delta' [Actinomycetota bacterium]|nr:DNA polymerase III subunit delta' [Actinomycetota bacterium]
MSVWDRVAGSRAAAALARQVAAGGVAHAWLLLGAPGSGKQATAVCMAAALECPVRPAAGCGECSSCLRVVRQRHPDVHHVVPEGPLIPVDTVREAIIPEAARSPFEGAYKVFVVEEADRMNDAAQNALLKTLEEPQPDTVFVLVSDHEDDLLETIRSRCRVVRLDPVPEERIVELLRAEGAADDVALLAARAADGDGDRARALAFDDHVAARRRFWAGVPARLTSPVDALDAATEVVEAARAEVKARERAQRDAVAELADAMGEGRGTATARNALAKRHRRELRRVEELVLGEALAALGSFYRDVVALRRGASDAVVNLDRLDELDAWAAADVGDAALLAAAERCVTARASLTRNANVPLQLEATLLELARLAPPPARLAAR